MMSECCLQSTLQLRDDDIVVDDDDDDDDADDKKNLWSTKSLNL